MEWAVQRLPSRIFASQVYQRTDRPSLSANQMFSSPQAASSKKNDGLSRRVPQGPAKSLSLTRSTKPPSNRLPRRAPFSCPFTSPSDNPIRPHRQRAHPQPFFRPRRNVFHPSTELFRHTLQRGLTIEIKQHPKPIAHHLAHGLSVFKLKVGNAVSNERMHTIAAEIVMRKNAPHPPRKVRRPIARIHHFPKNRMQRPRVRTGPHDCHLRA